jgi:putative Mg2+ transporter-C (MgtC) family protein
VVQEYFEIAFRLVAALVAGGLIGLERSHRGRPAGFRTHALVCLASSLLMLVTVYELHWIPKAQAGAAVVLDPTRMAQGIMTGIGFYFAAAAGTALAIGTLSLFRWVEQSLPTESYANFMVRFERDAALSEAELRELVANHGFSLHNMSFRLHREVGELEYRTVLRTMRWSNLEKLSNALRLDAKVLEYRIAPASE